MNLKGLLQINFSNLCATARLVSLYQFKIQLKTSKNCKSGSCLLTYQDIKQGSNTFIALPKSKAQTLPLFRLKLPKTCKSSKVRVTVTYLKTSNLNQ